MALLGVLNSAAACFWLKQVCHHKGNGGIGGGIASEDWERFYEFTGTKLQEFPLPKVLPLEFGRSLDALSFILSLALPLVVDIGNERSADQATGEQVMFKLPHQPFGRRVSNRMLRSAQAAQKLADEVSAGDCPLRAFGEDPIRPAANATELAALKALGGPEYGLYQLRFTQSPLAQQQSEPVILRITPGQQRILGEAADFLRTRQPRSGVTVQGLVVRLHRSGALGPGDVVIEGIDDDSGSTRRYRLELTEDDYNDAVRAHRNGLKVSVTGDREERGTHLYLRRLTTFSVIPGLDYEDEDGLPT